METIQVPTEKIRDVIGTGGKVIRGLIEETGCAVDIDDDGTCRVASPDRSGVRQCVAMIEELIAEAEEGVIYDGVITRITDFGAFVKIVGTQEGLVHISEIASVRLGSVEDVLSEGQEITVKCVAIDERGKIRLTMKEVEQTNEDVVKKIAEVVEKGGTFDPEAAKARSNDRDRKGGNNRRPRRSA